jgi:hypothetical protein
VHGARATAREPRNGREHRGMTRTHTAPSAAFAPSCWIG